MKTTNNFSTNRPPKFWNFLFGLLLTITGIFSLLALVLNQTLFSTNFYLPVLSQAGIYNQSTSDQISEMLAPYFSQASNNGNTPSVLNLFVKANLFDSIVPENYYKDQSQNMVQAFVDYLNLKQPTLSLGIDLTPIKSNLQADTLQGTVDKFVSSLPDCSGDNLNLLIQWATVPDNTDLSKVTLCKPTEPVLTIFKQIVSSFLSGINQVMPDAVSMTGLMGAGDGVHLIPDSIYPTYEIIRLLLFYLPWVSCLLGLIILLINLKTPKAMLRTFGISLILSGGLVLIGFFVVSQLAAGIISQYSGSIPFQGISSVLSTGAVAIVNKIFQTGLITAGIALISGIILSIISGLVKN